MPQSAFYLDAMSALVEAIVRAEGGEQAMVRAIQCSFPDCRTLDEALARTCKTIRNRILAYVDFVDKPLYVSIRLGAKDPWTGEDRPRRLRLSDDFIAFLGARWAPIGVVNDPGNLNTHWIGNVQKIYARLIAQTPASPEDEITTV